MELLDRFRARYPFPLDDFQEAACRRISEGHSVIVSAPTGAGKTLVAEFAIHAARERGQPAGCRASIEAERTRGPVESDDPTFGSGGELGDGGTRAAE